MKVLTVIATVFMPLTFITGLYGMNVDLPHFGLGGTTMFWVLMVDHDRAIVGGDAGVLPTLATGFRRINRRTT